MPSDNSDRYDTFWAEFRAFGRWCGRNAIAIGAVVAGLMLIATFVLSVWQPIRSRTHRTVILYTGTSVADASRMGEVIRQHFEANGSNGLVRYQVELRPSQGLEANRRAVAGAREGDLVIGFDQDGFDPPETVRTLIPLTKLHLHVVAHKKDVEDALEWAAKTKGKGRWKEAGADQYVPTLRLLRDYWAANPRARPLGFFLGPQGSGSRQIAERVLKHYGLPLQDVDSENHDDWPKAYRLLRNRELDLIFDASDLGSSFMASRAAEDRFALIGLDDVDGLIASYPFCRKEVIPKGAYTAGLPFCRADLDTVATQRLVVCNRSMPAYDAYYLTTGIREAVRQSVPNVPWDKEASSPGTGLVCPLHPGVEDYRQGRTPMAWLATLSDRYVLPLVPIGIGFLVWAVRRLLNRRPAVAPLDTTKTPASGTTPPGTDPGSGPPPQPAPLDTPPAPPMPTPAPTANGTSPEVGRPTETAVVLGRPNRFADPGVGPAARQADHELLRLQIRCEYLLDELDDPFPGPSQSFFQQWKKKYDALVRDANELRQELGDGHDAALAELSQNLGKLQLDYARARDQAKVGGKVRH